MAGPLSGRVALVAGATRGAGRGIAIALGEAGATVYCTGRSSRLVQRPPRPPDASPFELRGRPETIEETAELVSAAGGTGVPLRIDHTDAIQVEALLARILRDHERLDVLVNDVWGGDALTEWGLPFWQLDLAKGRTMLERGVLSHVITSRYVAAAMVAAGSGLIVEITDGERLDYRGSLFYDLVKTGVIRLAFVMAEELRPHGVTALALTPGFLRSEAVLEHFGVTEATWRDAVAADLNFVHSETPRFVGRAVAALAADPEVIARSGMVWSSWELARSYGFSDADGARPDWGAHARREPFGRASREAHRRFLAGFVDDER
jgi:NAD(P)-dependent dehydrogenase (short-subunit alcohol dehydrogenase family)